MRRGRDRRGAGAARGEAGGETSRIGSPGAGPRAAAPAGVGGSPRVRVILLACVVAVSTVLTVGAFVPAPHTGGDNAAYLTLAYSLLTEGSYTELFDPAGLPHTKYPPVFPILLAGFMLAGFRTWTAFKALAVISTVAASALTFLWAERRLGPWWGAGVALLFAASPAVVYYGHWILSDPTFVAFTLLALWALERADREDAARGWLPLGVAAAALAYFTRSAGLPLVVALLGWLALRRRWRALGTAAAALVVPMALWAVRARGAGQGEYVSEFWLVDPYQPDLGRVGLPGLLGRMGENLAGYVTAHVPAGIVGGGGAGVAAFGVALALAAGAGWALSARRRVGPAELFLPLYLGLILLWPAVWSGDRFALPVVPLLLAYAALGLSAGVRRASASPAAVTGAGTLAMAAVLVPALGAWGGAVRQASACSAAVRAAGPFACWGAGVGEFAEAAAWSGANLPGGSAVLSRKPRIFYVLSGVPSRTFPFTEDAGAHLGMADEVGARYVLLDRWDGLAGRYVVPAVAERPGAFCMLRSFGDGTRILGILPPGERGPGLPADAEGIRLQACPPDYVEGDGSSAYSTSSSRVPLLEGMDP